MDAFDVIMAKRADHKKKLLILTQSRLKRLSFEVLGGLVNIGPLKIEKGLSLRR